MRSIAMLATALPAIAQLPGGWQVFTAWDSKGITLSMRYSEDWQTTARWVPRRQGDRERLVKAPAKHARLGVYEGVFYAHGWDPSQQVMVFWKETKPGVWQTMGSMKDTPEAPIRGGLAYPLDEGDFLVVARPGTLFCLDEKACYPFAVARKRGDRFEVDRLLSFGEDAPLVLRAQATTRPDGSRAVQRTYNPDLRHLSTRVLQHQFIPLEDGRFVIVDRQLGICSVFTGKGRLQRTRHLYPLYSQDKQRLQEDRYLRHAPPVLCVQPTLTGTLLMACRPLLTVLTSHEDTPADTSLGANQDPNRRRMAQQQLGERQRRFDEVVYFDFDPDTGKFKEEGVPPGLKSRIPTTQELSRFAFYPKPSGQMTAGFPVIPPTH